jgi:hypothetical protein
MRLLQDRESAVPPDGALPPSSSTHLSIMRKPSLKRRGRLPIQQVRPWVVVPEAGALPPALQGYDDADEREDLIDALHEAWPSAS